MRKKTRLLCRISIALFFVFLCYNHFSTVLDISEESFTNEKLCPACYGKNLCPKFHSGQLELLSWSKLKAFQVLNGKNVYYALLDQEELVVKKLAHNVELYQVDRHLCAIVGKVAGCDRGGAILSIVEKSNQFYPHDLGAMINNLSVHFNTDLFRCPSQRLFQHLSETCLMRNSLWGSATILERTAMVTFTAMVNPEPLILEMFPAREGWPFPDLHGWCGRTCVVENAGRMLSEFEDASWRVRVELAIQILKLAQQLTDNSLNFALYMTDVNLHNFAVDEEGVVRLIDLENIIVVDKSAVRKEKPPGWDEPYVNLGTGCPDCLSFSVSDLCTHEVSDHNYYAVCRGILAPQSYYSRRGLLHDIPQLREGTPLYALMQKCARPTYATERLDSVQEFIEALEALVY